MSLTGRCVLSFVFGGRCPAQVSVHLDGVPVHTQLLELGYGMWRAAYRVHRCAALLPLLRAQITKVLCMCYHWRIYRPASRLEVSAKLGRHHVQGSPHTAHGAIIPEGCFCPVDAGEWKASMQCRREPQVRQMPVCTFIQVHHHWKDCRISR